MKQRTASFSASYGFSDYYVIGGSLPLYAPSYVERPADAELYANLTKSNLCYVLSTRQVGKSSLMVRTAARLRNEGVAVAVVDLTALGLNLTMEQWYYGMLERIGEQLDIEDELDDYWLANTRMGLLQRWMSALREVVLARHKGKVIIFIDEVDAVLSLPFETDEFFGGIRELHHRRNEDPELNRLTFCLLGVATPSDLVKNVRITPFNIGTRIELTDFTEEEATPLMEGMAGGSKRGAELIKRVIYWTGGHPFLTQYLCKVVSEAELDTAGGVDRACEELFLSSRAREQNDNLLFVSHRILKSGEDTAGLLDLYGKVRRYKRVPAGEMNRLVDTLWLSGLVRIKDGYLSVRNRIYHRVFDRHWIESNMPDAELRRVRAAYRQGMIRAAIVAIIIIIVMFLLALYAFTQRDRAMSALAEAEYQRQAALEANKMAEDRGVEVQSQNIMREKAQLLADYKGREADLLSWELIKNDANAPTFEAYLELNPPEEFARLARKKLETIKPLPEAQTRGVIRGRVYDVNTSQPIAGATVTAKGRQKDLELTMFSNSEGEFFIPLLPAGLYTINIECSGYEKKEARDFSVTTGKINRLGPEIGGLR